MFGLGPATRIYLAAGVTDMRKGFEGLYGLVRDRLACEPLSGLSFIKTSYTRNINDLAPSSIGDVPVRFLPCFFTHRGAVWV